MNVLLMALADLGVGVCVVVAVVLAVACLLDATDDQEDPR